MDIHSSTERKERIIHRALGGNIYKWVRHFRKYDSAGASLATECQYLLNWSHTQQQQQHLNDAGIYYDYQVFPYQIIYLTRS